MARDGYGLIRIAKRLNAEHVPAPRGTSWSPSAVRDMLYRPLYRGQIVWNKSQEISRGGTKAPRIRPENEWLTLDAPALRIVPEELRLAALREWTRRATPTRARPSAS